MISTESGEIKNQVFWTFEKSKVLPFLKRKPGRKGENLSPLLNKLEKMIGESDTNARGQLCINYLTERKVSTHPFRTIQARSFSSSFKHSMWTFTNQTRFFTFFLQRFVTFVHFTSSFNFLFLDLSLLQACFWRELYAVLLREMEIISRVVSFDCVIAIFRARGYRSMWFPLLTARLFAGLDRCLK